MSKTDQQIEFSSVMACYIHDMKNSLFMLLQSMDTLAESMEPDSEQQSQLANIHYEAYRVNTNMVQLLALYRHDKDQLPLQLSENYLIDLLEDLVARNQLYINNQHIEVETDVDFDLCGYYDTELTASMLNDVFINALRYTKNKIKLSAYMDGPELVIQLEDNGPGYPEKMLKKMNNDKMEMGEFQSMAGRSGLGLYFIKLVAAAHINGERAGRIKMDNESCYGGSRFQLRLP